MKNLRYKSLFVALLTFVVAGCESFLTEDPRDIVSPSNFFNSAAEVKSAVNGLYDIYHNNSLHGNIGLTRFYENGADVTGPNRVFGQLEAVQNYTLDEGVSGPFLRAAEHRSPGRTCTR